MAWSAGSHRLGSQTSAPTASWSIIGTTTATVGDVYVMVVSSNNFATTDTQSNDHVSVTGNSDTWVKIGEFTNGNGAANAGVTVSAWYCIPTSTTGLNGTTINFSADPGKAVYQIKNFTPANGFSAVAGTLQTSAVDSGTGLASMTVSGLGSNSHLYVRATGLETNSDVQGTPTSTYAWVGENTTGDNSTTGGSAASNIAAGWEWLISTSSSSTSSLSWLTVDSASIMFALDENIIINTIRGHGQAQTFIAYTSFADTFTRTVSPGIGTADSGGPYSGGSDSLWDTNGSVAEYTLDSIGINSQLLRQTIGTSGEIVGRIKFSALPSSDVILAGWRYASKASPTGIETFFRIGSTGNTVFEFRYNNEGTTSNSSSIGTLSINTWYWLRTKVISLPNTEIIYYFKWWLDGNSEPTTWTHSGAVTQNTYLQGSFGITVSAGPGSKTVSFDDVSGKFEQGDYRFSQARASILSGVISTYAQAQAQLKSFGIKSYAQANSDIKATDRNFAQANAWVETINIIYAQANAYINATDRDFAQANSSIKATSTGFTTPYSQANATIKSRDTAFSQAHVWIKQTYPNRDILIYDTFTGSYASLYAHTPDIGPGYYTSDAMDDGTINGGKQSGRMAFSPIYNSYGTQISKGEPLWDVLNTGSTSVHLRTRLKGLTGGTGAGWFYYLYIFKQLTGPPHTVSWYRVTNNVETLLGSTTTSITNIDHAQIESSGTTPTYLKAKLWDGSTEPDSYDLSVSDSTAGNQVQGYSGTFANYYDSGEGDFWASYWDSYLSYGILGPTFANAQAKIKSTGTAHGQSQASIKSAYRVFAQAQADILTSYNGYAQAQTDITASLRVFAQVQAQVSQVSAQYAQAQGNIIGFGGVYAQALGQIGRTDTLYIVIDESVIDDNDYIVHPFAASTNTFSVEFGIPVDEPPFRLDHRIMYRALTGSGTATLYMYLFEGATQRATYNHTITTTPTTFTDLLTSGEMSSIVDYSALRIRFDAVSSAGVRPIITWVQIALPFSAIKRGFSQAQAFIIAGTNVHAQANAYIILSGLTVYAQAQADTKATSRVYAQSNADIKATVQVVAQANANIETAYTVYAQAQSDIKATSRAYAQAQTDIKATTTVYAQAQACILARVYGQAQADIKAITWVFAQAQANIEAIISGYAQAQGDIKASSTVYAQAQTDIKATNAIYAQSNANIKAVDRGVAQAQACILGWAFGQAQANIKATSVVYAQAQASIKAVSFGYAQAQARIYAFNVQVYAQAQSLALSGTRAFGQALARLISFNVGAFGQAQTDVKVTTFVFAQAQSDIKATTFVFAQAQSAIKATSQVYAQANADIEVITAVYGQAQADIEVTSSIFGQAQADIKAVYQGYAQSQSDIKTTYLVYAQAQSDIEAFGYANAQAQADIKSTSRVYAQAQSDIKAAYQVWGQSQADIKATTWIWAQAQADINATQIIYAQAQSTIEVISIVFGQAQADINATYQVFAQAQTDIEATPNVYAQAQADINATSRVYGQAQTTVLASSNIYAQAQSIIRTTTTEYAQANAQVLANYTEFGQAQARIYAYGITVYGQADANIISGTRAFAQAQTHVRIQHQVFGQANAWIIASTKVGQAQAIIRSRVRVYAQAQTQIGGFQYGQAQAQMVHLNFGPYAAAVDKNLAEYLGLQNKTIEITMKVWEPTYVAAKLKVQEAVSMLRSVRRRFAPLYIQNYDRHYMAMPKSIKMAKDAGSSRTTIDYNVIFEAKPWLIHNTTQTISGTGTIDTGPRPLTDGGWTPTIITVSGTDITISAVTEYGQNAGSVTIEGTVADFVIDTDNFTSSDNAVISPKNYGIYVGPGKTTFTITGATSCTIQWNNRWYL